MIHGKHNQVADPACDTWKALWETVHHLSPVQVPVHRLRQITELEKEVCTRTVVNAPDGITTRRS